MDELAAALAFDRGLRARAAQETIELPEGLVVLHEPLRSMRYLNALILDAPLPEAFGPDEVTGLADVRLGHLPYRSVVVDDAAAAERLAPELQRHGWTVERTLFMRWRPDAEIGISADLAREISDDELRMLQREIHREEHAGASAVAEALSATLIAGQDAMRVTTRARCFGAGAEGELSASCTLFFDRPEGEGGLALIDEVGTLSTQRRRGFGRAVVAAALEAARREGCAPIFLPADVEDWPRGMYERMGFEPLGTQVTFTLHPDG